MRRRPFHYRILRGRTLRSFTYRNRSLRWALHPRFAPRGRAAYESYNAKLKQIYWAQLIWCEDNGGDTNMLVSIADLVGTNAYFSKPPVCPEGGRYTLGRAGAYPQCSIPMHSLEFGRVVVVNEAGAPMAGVEVSFELPVSHLVTARRTIQARPG